MNTSVYRNFLKILEKWPVDKSKGHRDVGLHLREVMKTAIASGNPTIQTDHCERQIAALKKIADGHYAKLYRRERVITATGLNKEECSVALSNEYLDSLSKPNIGIVRNVFNSFKYNRAEKQDDKNKQAHVDVQSIKTISHIPVMLNEAVKYLHVDDGGVFIDMTFGNGGHTKKILETCPDCTVLALDRDPVAFQMARELARLHPGKIIPLNGKFSELPGLLREKGFFQKSIDGILFDFGCSAMQLKDPRRGFSFLGNSLLDMRMDAPEKNPVTARDVLRLATEIDLVKIFRIYGDEKKAIKIARAIVEARYMIKKIETTQELVQVVNSVCDDEVRLDKLNRPISNATKVFQALRIFVNNELNEINYAMVIAHKYLKINGRLVTVSFHSLEDTIVKRHLAGNIIENMANPISLKYFSPAILHDEDVVNPFITSDWEPLTKHVVLPTDEEVERNPQSRSARLRAAVKKK